MSHSVRRNPSSDESDPNDDVNVLFTSDDSDSGQICSGSDSDEKVRIWAKRTIMKDIDDDASTVASETEEIEPPEGGLTWGEALWRLGFTSSPFAWALRHERKKELVVVDVIYIRTETVLSKLLAIDQVKIFSNQSIGDLKSKILPERSYETNFGLYASEDDLWRGGPSLEEDSAKICDALSKLQKIGDQDGEYQVSGDYQVFAELL